jgi:hypothetical protein
LFGTRGGDGIGSEGGDGIGSDCRTGAPRVNLTRSAFLIHA